MTHRQLSTVSDLWQQRSEDQYPTMWIGRSVFNRTGISATTPIALPRHEHPDPAAMEDDEDAASGGVQHEGDPAEQELDGARVAVHPLQRPGSEGRRTKDQRAGIDDASRAPGRGHEERNRACAKGVEGLTDAEDQGRPCTGRDRHDDWQVQGKLDPQIPEKYGDWASEEERQNGDNMHPDLKRYVTWRRLKRTMDAKATTENMYLKYGNDPEANAKVPPPPVSETGYGSAWSVVEPGQGSDQRPLLHRAQRNLAPSVAVPRGSSLVVVLVVLLLHLHRGVVPPSPRRHRSRLRGPAPCRPPPRRSPRSCSRPPCLHSTDGPSLRVRPVG